MSPISKRGNELYDTCYYPCFSDTNIGKNTIISLYSISSSYTAPRATGGVEKGGGVTILVSLILILVKIRSLVLIQLVLVTQHPGLQGG